MAWDDWSDWYYSAAGDSGVRIFSYLGSLIVFLAKGDIVLIDETTDFTSWVLDSIPLTGSDKVLDVVRYRDEFHIVVGLAGSYGKYVYRWAWDGPSPQKTLDYTSWPSSTHAWTVVYLDQLIQANSVGVVIGGAGFEGANTYPVLYFTYNGINWFEGNVIETHDPLSRPPGIMASQYIVSIKDAFGTYRKSVNLQAWMDYSPLWFYPKVSSFNGQLFGPDFVNIYAAGSNFYVATRDGTSIRITGNIGSSPNILTNHMGYWWSFATNGPCFSLDQINWYNDWVGSAMLDGVTGPDTRLLFALRNAGGYCTVLKRNYMAGYCAGVKNGKNPMKISIDRNSEQVYCTTVEYASDSTDYWVVASDLIGVGLLEQSTTSGIYGSVHSHQAEGVYLFGAIRDSLVEVSESSGYSLVGLGIPLVNSTEATALYSLRADGNPDDILVTVSVSGMANTKTYSLASGWIELTNNNLFSNCMVRESGNSFVGAWNPTSSGMVDYSPDGGYYWEIRDTGLPVVTITDLEFA
jgi:hypothetical protein